MSLRGPLTLFALTCALQNPLADGFCFPGFCMNGERDWSGAFWNCECDTFWGGACCDLPECEAVDSKLAQNVSLKEWIRASWYIQEQQMNGYQPPENLFCVVATYNDEGAEVPKYLPYGFWNTWDGKVVSVYNNATTGSVNGSSAPGNSASLCARVKEGESAKLSVAPCFLPNAFAGPYWILSVGTSPSNRSRYEWGIVVAGEPSVPFADGCTTPTRGINGAGLWLFAREPVASQETMDAMYAELAAKGISRSLLLPVEQEGCDYDGYFIKPDTL